MDPAGVNARSTGIECAKLSIHLIDRYSRVIIRAGFGPLSEPLSILCLVSHMSLGGAP